MAKGIGTKPFALMVQISAPLTLVVVIVQEKRYFRALIVAIVLCNARVKLFVVVIDKIGEQALVLGEEYTGHVKVDVKLVNARKHVEFGAGFDSVQIKHAYEQFEFA